MSITSALPISRHWPLALACLTLLAPCVRAQNVFNEGDALSERNYNTDTGPTNSQLTLDFPITQAGVLQNILIWGENDGQGGLNGVGQSFKLYVLRPLNSTNYQVMFATGYMTIASVGINTFAVPGTPFGLQTNDVIAHYGRGIPFSNNTGGPSSVYIATNGLPLAPPVVGTTVTVPSSTYPSYNDGGRNYAVQVQALGSPFLVTSNSDNGPGSLRQAVLNAAALGGTSTINFTSTLSGQTIMLAGGQIVLSNNVTIDASTLANGIQINGNANSRIFSVNSGATVVLNSLTITNGYDGSSYGGGGILNDGTLTINQCNLANNTSGGGGGGFGGGIQNDYDGAALTVNNCTFSGNRATGSGIINGGEGGGIGNLYGALSLTLNNCTFTGNQADYGGGIDNQNAGASFVANNCTFTGNQCSQRGGGIDNVGTKIDLTNSIVCSNSAPANANIFGSVSAGANNLVDTNALLAPLGNYGGSTPTMPPLAGSPAIDAGAATTLTIDQRGHPRLSGAHVDIGAVEVDTNTIVTTNTDSGVAGSLRYVITNTQPSDLISFAPNLSGATILLTNGQISLNQDVAIDGSALANGIQLNGNGLSRIFLVNYGVTVTLNALTITNGVATGDGSSGVLNGGGIYSGGTLTVNNSTLANNNANQAGGGIFNGGNTLTVNNCTFSGNQAAAEGGGGIFNFEQPLTVNNCTFSGNQANNSSFGGGGIANWTYGNLTVNNSTISGNQATGGGNGGGIYNRGNGTLNLTNSVVCSNTAASGPNIYNLGTDNTGTSLVDTNAMLASLGNYGGLTQTMPPQFGSPAINAGSDATTSFLTTDQRGQPRKSGTHVDIGAVEFQVGPVVSSTTDSGENTLRDAITYNPVGTTVTFASNLSGQNINLTSGEIILATNLNINASSLANGVAVYGNGTSRVFLINPGVTNILTGLSIGFGNGTGPGPALSGYGGSIYNQGNLTLSQCTIALNNCSTAGGGIYNNRAPAGMLTLNACTLADNSAPHGGAVQNEGVLAAYNCTFTANTATSQGGAISAPFSAPTALTLCTIVGNSSGDGGGVYGTVVNLTNTIVAGNSAAANQNLSGTFMLGGNNLIGGNPGLAALGYYGGLTPTMPPTNGSPAIDMGAATTFTTDQRGYPRPSGAGEDIGAVEVQVAGAPFVLTGTNGAAGTIRLVNGQAQINFTNLMGGNFTVFASTNVALPFNTWSNLGPAVETPVGSGQFQFNDPSATNYRQRFYRVSSP
jgi:fibronectin-binding autotransporter adhesin